MVNNGNENSNEKQSNFELKEEISNENKFNLISNNTVENTAFNIKDDFNSIVNEFTKSEDKIIFTNDKVANICYSPMIKDVLDINKTVFMFGENIRKNITID